jgi:hypothetical protein
MGITIGVNPPKTPVTEGSSDKSPASVPNVCKMPGPPAPFVPTPLPNIGRSEDSPDGYTTTVKFEGKKVAIKGATYKSTGSPDAASKGTGGGIVSSVEEGKTGFAAPGSMNVKAEGKNIQLLSDGMLNNGSNPYNSATLPGNLQLTETMKDIADQLCDEFCREVRNNKKSAARRKRAAAAKGKSRAWVHDSKRLEARLRKSGAFSKFVKFAEELAPGLKPDCALFIGGEIRQIFDFKFPGDSWHDDQKLEYQNATKDNREPVTINEENCGC